MNAQEFANAQIQEAGCQLANVVEGLSAEACNHRISPSAMTIAETCAHLAEVYFAFVEDILAGRRHEWGTRQANDPSWPAIWHEAHYLREKAIQALDLDPSDHNLNLAAIYIFAHDFYHVGQMCQTRISIDPGWDPYSIYPPD